MSESEVVKKIFEVYDGVMGIARLGDTLLVVVESGDKVELLIKASKLWEEYGVDIVAVPKDALKNLHPEFIGEFEVLHDTDGFLFETLSEMLRKRGLYPTLENLKDIEIVEVEKCRE